MVITIDGPSASGKSTIAQALAKKLGFYFVASGYLYRALAYLLVYKKNYSLDALSTVSNQDITELIDPEKLLYCYTPEKGPEIVVDGITITTKLKSPTIDEAASILGTNSNVRAALMGFQRMLAKNYNLILEGRDSGSVVFPNADVKFYLTATPQVRAKRYQEDQSKKGKILSFDEALSLTLERDFRDTTRAIAPLIIPKGAIGIDNSNLTHQQTMEIMLSYIPLNS